jgi:hypothetical protein
MLYARTLIMNKNYSKAEDILKRIYILPNEGATDGRELYKEAKMMLALEQMKKGKYPNALKFIAEARAWPDNLGVGKPYESDIDERLEDWLAYESYVKSGNKSAAKSLLEKILRFDTNKSAYGRHISPVNHLITAWALRKSGKAEQGESLLRSKLKNDPDNLMLQWAVNTYNRIDIQVPEEKAYDENYRILKSLLAFSNQQ